LVPSFRVAQKGRRVELKYMRTVNIFSEKELENVISVDATTLFSTPAPFSLTGLKVQATAFAYFASQLDKTVVNKDRDHCLTSVDRHMG
jgi:hypothetical protein